MYKIIFCLLLSYASVAQSNWFLEGEVRSSLLSKYLGAAPVSDEIDATPPIPLGAGGSISLFKTVNTGLAIGLGVGYEANRNCTYFLTYPFWMNMSCPPTIGYYRNWNYVTIPFNIKYAISRKWSAQLQLNNAFLVGKSDWFVTKSQRWRPRIDETGLVSSSATTSERFHSLCLSAGYGIPLKNGHHLLLKGFYEYVFLNSTPASADNNLVPNQLGIGLVYQLTNVFQGKIK